jgi:hypothetical protein
MAEQVELRSTIITDVSASSVLAQTHLVEGVSDLTFSVTHAGTLQQVFSASSYLEVEENE